MKLKSAQKNVHSCTEKCAIHFEDVLISFFLKKQMCRNPQIIYIIIFYFKKLLANFPKKCYFLEQENEKK